MKLQKSLLLPLFMLVFSGVASAHGTHDIGGLSGGFVNGLIHPLLGVDHVVAMFAVGLWGAFLGQPAIWVLPVVFPLVMAFGGALAIAGIYIPGIETGIALSAVVIGAMVTMVARPPLWIAAIIVGGFAIFHGYAHGSELSSSDSALSFSIGFVLSTGLLHILGIVFGFVDRWTWGKSAIRVSGAGVCLTGLGYLSGIL